jgi:hypothetical protein
MATSDETPAQDTGTAALGNPTEAPAAAPKLTSAFRRTLLERLPRLGYTAWTVKDSFSLDDEWQAITNAKADAVLEPLEAVAPKHQ